MSRLVRTMAARAVEGGSGAGRLRADERAGRSTATDDGTNLWPDRLQRLYAAARASATRLTLVLTGACYSGAEALASDRPEGHPRRQRHLDVPLLRRRSC